MSTLAFEGDFARCVLAKLCITQTIAFALHSPPKSSYSTSALPSSMLVYGTEPTGTIGVHWPREIVRIERDWSGGEVCQ